MRSSLEMGRDLIPWDKISFHEATSPDTDASGLVAPVYVHIRVLCDGLPAPGRWFLRSLVPGSVPLCAKKWRAQPKALILTTLDLAFV